MDLLPRLNANDPQVVEMMKALRGCFNELKGVDAALVADLALHASNEAMQKINEIANRSPSLDERIWITLVTLTILGSISREIRVALTRVA